MLRGVSAGYVAVTVPLSIGFWSSNQERSSSDRRVSECALTQHFDGRLVFTPTTTSDGTRVCQFTGHGVLDPILAGTLTALLNNSNDLK